MCSLVATFHQAMDTFPFVAILRGLLPEEAVSIGGVLVEEGFVILEVPLNSPRPFESIRLLADAFGDKALIGAGTVLEVEQVQQLQEAGGVLVVSPDTYAPVIAETRRLGMLSIPGCWTPTEAFAAIRAGAHALKWFPAKGADPSILQSMKAVLPATAPVCAVGGVNVDTLATYWQAGAKGFGVGGALFRPGDTPEQVRAKAQALRAGWKELAQ